MKASHILSIFIDLEKPLTLWVIVYFVSNFRIFFQLPHWEVSKSSNGRWTQQQQSVYGVPQVSVLGLILLSIYINGLFKLKAYFRIFIREITLKIWKKQTNYLLVVYNLESHPNFNKIFIAGRNIEMAILTVKQIKYLGFFYRF